MQVLKQLQIPYSFAKRHGVLLRYEGDQAFIVRRESTPLLALQEARRFLGVAAQHQLCSDEEFHQLLSSSYAGDSGESQQVAAGLEDHPDLLSLADQLKITPDVYIEADVGIGPIPTGFGIQVTLNIHLEGLEQAEAQKLVDAAHIVCPYSNATRGNIDVTLNVIV